MMNETFAAVENRLPRELVLASAGTGKTFRISSRIIGLLAAGAAPESIFASTFTRKAAGEILDRVLERLAAAALDEGTARELAEHATLPGAASRPASSAEWLTLLERTVSELHRLNVGTLDAFFVRTASSFADEVALPPGWTIADAAADERVIGDALHSLLEVADRAQFLELVRGLEASEASRSVHDALLRRARDLVEIHHALDAEAADAWQGLSALAASAPPDLEERRLKLVLALAKVEAPATRDGTPHAAWTKALRQAAAHVLAGDWAAYLETTLCTNARGPEPAFYRIPIPDEIQVLLEEGCILARFHVARTLARQCEAMGRLAARLAEAVDRARRDRGAFGFADVTRLLGGPEPLCQRPDLHYRLDARVQHILLDEFQDTSLHQWEALEPLVAELLSGHAEERAAVVVADPKQSIYGWRGAAPQLVEHVGGRYTLDRDDLARSWRSSQIVLDVVNRVFDTVADNPTLGDNTVARRVARDWLEAFPPHEAARDLPGYVRIVVGPDEDVRTETRPELCQCAAEMVAALRQESPGMTIGVLTRKNSTVARLIMELRRLGIQASEEGGNPLTDSRAVGAVLALLHLADHPGDTLARYHVARTPVGAAVGFTDHTNEGGARRLAERTRRGLLEQGYGPTLTELAAKLADSCGPRDRRRLAQLAELGFRYDARATLRPGDFIRLVRAERVEDPTSADVRVMTVHQSKGLEFDIVVLPELDVPLVRERPAPLTYRPEPAARITRAFPPVKKSLRELLEDQTELMLAHEQLSAARWRDAYSGLYVALTRARHALHLLVKPDSADRNGERKQGKGCTAASLLRAALAPGAVAVPDALLFEHGDPAWHRKTPREQPTPAATGSAALDEASAQVRLRPSSGGRTLARATPSSLVSGTSVDIRPLLRLDMAAAERGTVAHAWFERIGWIEDGLPDEPTLREIARAVAPHLPAEEVDTLRERFLSWMQDDAVRRCLGRGEHPRGAAVEREVAFVHRSDGRIVEGVIDRLVLVREGDRVVEAQVLDFKTDALPQADLPALQARADYYRPQLEAYREVVCSWYDLPPERVAARLLFVEVGQAVDL